ncbi:MAG: membrane protein insertase YidC [Prevotellaceae bacterium]|jgi:YidC/Oxa1 family membrane protein insertase|nr:membrane protein insertase YidC [Prevotellaceae bacterium]
MDKNSILGIVAIGAILIGFSFYNSKQNEKYAQEKHRADSVARASMVAEKDFAPVTTEIKITTAPQPKSELDKASVGTEEFYTLENDVVEVTLTNRGGRVYAVRLKNYLSSDSLPLALFDGTKNDFSFTFFTNNSQNFETGKLFFTPQLPEKKYVQSDEQVLQFPMRLQLANGQYVDYLYSLAKGSYMLDFKMIIKGLDNATNLDLLWSMDVKRQEKAFKNENNYSTLAYQYPNEASIEDLGVSEGSKEANVTTKLSWLAFKQQFFSSILVANGEKFTGAHLAYMTYQPDNMNRMLKRYVAKVQMPYEAQQDQAIDLSFYFGPNKYRVLKAYDHNFEKLVPLGGWIIGWVNKYLIIPIFDFLGTKIASYGIIILILTIIIKILLFPLTFKSYLSSAKMRVLKPDIDKIKQKYPKKEDAMKVQQETMALYKKTGVSPMGGCLPILIQFPILIAMFRFFPASIELRQQPFLWAGDLSAYDSILNLPFTIPFYGDHVSLFTLLMAAALFVSSRMSMAQTPDTGMPGMKFMTLYMMPAMMLFWFNDYSAGLSYYYFLSNLITIIQNFVTRRMVNEEKIHAKLKENSKKPVKKSRFQAMLEDAARKQQRQVQVQKKKK